jgi:glutamyl/glutaminyl-tRNA synthetase
MRGDDHISNTPKQIMLYEALGANLPRFAHLPMIHGLDGKKLSKRHGATAVGDYRHTGILPQAMLNFLALLGWSPGNDIEVMTVPQMIELFSTEGLSKKAAIFDVKKLEWMNGQHLSLLASETLAPLVSSALIDAGLATRDALDARGDWLLALIDHSRCARTIDASCVRRFRIFARPSSTILTPSRSSGRTRQPRARRSRPRATPSRRGGVGSAHRGGAARACRITRRGRREDLSAAARCAHGDVGESRNL